MVKPRVKKFLIHPNNIENIIKKSAARKIISPQILELNVYELNQPTLGTNLAVEGYGVV